MKIFPKHKYRRTLVSGFVLCFGSFVYAAETLSSTALFDSSSFAVGAYVRESSIEPAVSISGSGGSVVAAGAGSPVIFSGSNAEVELDQSSTDLMCLVSFRPKSGLVYSVHAGQIRDFELEFSSGSQTNSLRSTSSGFRWGLGISGMIAPMSPVSTGVTWGASYFASKVSFDRFKAGDTVFSSDETLRQQEIQAALQASRRWKMVEPFVGVKLFRVLTRIDDGATKQRQRGRVDRISPFAGFRWELFEKEFFQIEAAFLDEKSLSAGLVVQFL